MKQGQSREESESAIRLVLLRVVGQAIHSKEEKDQDAKGVTGYLYCSAAQIDTIDQHGLQK